MINKYDMTKQKISHLKTNAFHFEPSLSLDIIEKINKHLVEETERKVEKIEVNLHISLKKAKKKDNHKVGNQLYLQLVPSLFQHKRSLRE